MKQKRWYLQNNDVCVQQSANCDLQLYFNLENSNSTKKK